MNAVMWKLGFLTMKEEEILTEKLLDTFHLGVQERNLLPDGKVRISTIKKIIEKKLKSSGWFPIAWRPETPFQGALLEFRGDRNTVLLYKKAEVSYMNFEMLGKKEYSNCDMAIVNFMKYMFGGQIDGIDINYDI